MALDLNELANMPGYGRAKEFVKNKGFWREEYTFDDVIERLLGKEILILREDEILCRHYDHQDEYSLEHSLRKAMEA